MPQFHPDHLNYFKACFAAPPEQGPVGNSPGTYLRELKEITKTDRPWPNDYDQGAKLTREQVRQICRQPDIEVLVGYAAAMAWGGRNKHNYRMSLAENSVMNLGALLNDLKASARPRIDDFEATQEACRSIRGLGISFFTKLLFFFRPTPDAYILDQWTAKSALLLVPNCPIRLSSQGLPSPYTTPNEHEWFCRALEQFSAQIESDKVCSGEEVERTFFDKPGGDWRNYVRTLFGDSAKPKSSRKTNTLSQQPATAQPPDTPQHRFAARIAAAHERSLRQDRLLPGNGASLLASIPVRVNCGSRNGVNWQYDVQQKSVHAKAFIPKTEIDRLRLILATMEAEDIDIRCPPEQKTGSARITVSRGATAEQREWDAIAEEAVNAMNQLFETIGEHI